MASFVPADFVAVSWSLCKIIQFSETLRKTTYKTYRVTPTFY